MSNQIFISYAHINSNFIPVLQEHLQDYFDIWVDTAKIAAGRNWREEIDRAIKESFAVLIILTPESCESEYVTYEWAFALGLGTPVIPLLLEDCDDKIHPRLSPIQYFDFSPAQRFKEPWKELLDRLKAVQNESPAAGAAETTLRLMQMGKEQAEQNDLEHALSTFDDAMRLARAGLLDDIHYEKARVYLKMRDLDNADHNLTKALQLNPKHVRALIAAGDLYRMRADNATAPNEREMWLTKAEAQFREALNQRDDLLDTSGESVWASLGGILKRKNDLDAAIAAYKKAALIKRSSYPYNNLGMLYMQKNDLAHMRENFGLVELFAQARVNRDAGDEWAHNDLFMAQIVMDKVADAQTSLTRIKVVAPSYAIESLLRSLDSLAKVQGLPPATLNFVQQAIQELTAHLDYLSSGD